MVNPHYAKGRQYEWERVREHKNRGAFLAVRTAGSHSPWDVLALYSNRVVLEQCKRVTEPMPPERLQQEREFLARLRVPFGVETYLVVRSDHGTTRTYPVHRNGIGARSDKAETSDQETRETIPTPEQPTITTPPSNPDARSTASPPSP